MLTCCFGCCVQARLGCNSELILDEFGEKLLEELDYQQEARNIEVRPTATPCTVMCISRSDAQHVSTGALSHHWHDGERSTAYMLHVIPVARCRQASHLRCALSNLPPVKILCRSTQRVTEPTLCVAMHARAALC